MLCDNLQAKKGGNASQKKYVNARTKLKWRCSKGHEWEATPDSIRAGKWCHKCGGSMKLTIEEMQKIAAEKGGKCLSNAYVNLYTKLTWECSEGHIWEATPANIKKGSWCQTCQSSTKPPSV